MKKGRFIVLEGGVGCGKTTQFEKLKKRFPCWKFYREPGGTPFGEKIRDAVQGIHNYKVNPYASVLAYSSSRANLVREVIIPQLTKGKTVVLDRYWFSTYAYQGSDGISEKTVEKLNVIATGGLLPDLVLHYDLNPKIGLQRKAGQKDLDRYDVKDIVFHQEVRKRYLALSKKYSKIWRIIDASKSIEEVFKESLKWIKSLS